MSEHALAQTHPSNAPQAVANDSVLLQRLEREQAEQSALQQWQINMVCGTFAGPRIGYDFSRVLALTGMVRQNRPMLRTQPIVQRFPKDGALDSSSCPTCPDVESVQTSTTGEPTAEAATPDLEAAPTPLPSEPTEETATPGELALRGLIVEDSAPELSASQMKKSEFLSQLRVEVCRTVEAALAGTGWTTDDCPYLNHWFDLYSRKESAHIERAIRRYAPETSSATAAREYISVIAQRARQAAETWTRTGEITGVPEGIPLGLPGTGLVRGLVSGISSISFKARNGGARAADDPRAIQAKLGEGQPLEGSVRSRMESAFDMNFSHVRTHTDSTAAGLSTRFNARAFTVGEHVAFGTGEYRPGTLVGDALIAHEMAHVVQQSGGDTTVTPMETGNAGYNDLEKDADKSAVGAVASLWRDTKVTSVDIAQDAIPRLRSGLRLQRCGTTRTARRTAGSTAERISEDTLCPKFISMPARVRQPAVSASRGRCRMGLGNCTTPRGTCGSTESSGAAITATVNTAEGCIGELAFMQNLMSSNRQRTLSDGTHECMTFTTPHRDGGIPWKGCTLPVTGAGRHTISTDDCPNIRLRETLRDRPSVHMTAASVTESFKMFLLWKPNGESVRTAIANVTWGWNGSTRRREGRDCASRWTEASGSHTDGEGVASRDRPVTSPTVREDYGWRTCSEE